MSAPPGAATPTKTLGVSTPGGFVPFGNRFKISYTSPQGNQPVCLWKGGAEFALTIFSSPSGTGKTTLLQHLYYRLTRTREYASAPASDGEPNAVQRVYRRYFPPPVAPTLRFDFVPNFDDYIRASTGYVPQHAPKVMHWRVSDLLPASPKFLGCFFDNSKDIVTKRVGQFSGGQRSKIYACSALERLEAESPDCAFLLLDETFDGLGAGEATQCLKNIEMRWRSASKAPLHLLLVSHLDETELTDQHSTTLTLSVSSNTEKELVVRIENKCIQS